MEEPAGFGENESRMMEAIYERTKGDPKRFIDMWETGDFLGFDRQLTENTVTFLMGEGLVEIRSLGGTISITEEGNRRMHSVSFSSKKRNGPRVRLKQLIIEVRRVAAELDLSHGQITDLEIDLMTLEGQVRRTEPSSLIIRESLRAAGAILEQALPDEKISNLLESLSTFPVFE